MDNFVHANEKFDSNVTVNPERVKTKHIQNKSLANCSYDSDATAA